MTLQNRPLAVFLLAASLIACGQLGHYTDEDLRADVDAANTALTEKNFAAAEQVLREALQSKPGDPLLLNNLGVVLVRQERRKEALDAFNAALEAAGGHVMSAVVSMTAVQIPTTGQLSYRVAMFSFVFPSGFHDEPELLPAPLEPTVAQNAAMLKEPM